MIRLGKPVLFTLKDYTSAKQVVLTGSFNRWRKDELYMNKTANGWELWHTLGPGNYEYQFIVDGKTITTPNDNKSNLYLVVNPNYTFRLKGFANAKTFTCPACSITGHPIPML